MTPNPLVFSEKTAISKIEEIFKKKYYWSVYIGSSEKYVGIITRKDLEIRGRNKNPSTPASTIMSNHVYTIDLEEDVKNAITIINDKKINGLAVTKEGKPCGIITRYDIRKKYLKSISPLDSIDKDNTGDYLIKHEKDNDATYLKSSKLVNIDDLEVLIKNYEEFERVLNKTEYERYLGELESELDRLYFKRSILKSLSGFSVMNISIETLDKKILILDSDLIEAKRPNFINDEIRNEFISLFKKIVLRKNESHRKEEIEKLNILILNNVVLIWNRSTKYRLKKYKSKIEQGRKYLAQMKDSQIKYENLERELDKNNDENDPKIKIEKIEEIYDKIPNCIHEADIAIEDSKWLRNLTYSGFILGIFAIILAFVMYYHLI
nr:CBS domain-containing protein [uncultured Methanoregula sp.]